MLIDWFTVAAQVVNFLILMWLLKRFLYRPILDAIDAREQRVASELAQADATKAESLAAREEFQGKSARIDEQRDTLLREARADANAERQRLLEEARKAAADLAAQREENLRNDARILEQSLTRRAQQEVFAISRKALADLADARLEARMVDVLVGRLHRMSAADRTALVSAFGASAGPLTVRSAFDLPEAERAALQAALDETLGGAHALRFETAPDLVGGIEIVADGQKLGWSIDDYLASLQAGVDELLKGAATPPVAVPPSEAPSDAG